MENPQGRTNLTSAARRRQPTRRHRRNRQIRRALQLVAIAAFGFGLSTVALKHLTPSLFRTAHSSSPNHQAEQATRDLFRQATEDALRPAANRPVYPYSIVPGGVEDARELKWVAEHDPVVAAHYAGFDYEHAHVVQLVLARTVYLSYRIGNHVYWTRHRVTLKKGEKLITDGKITGRTRCANRVEEVPQQATSSSEPPAVKFDEPAMPGIAMVAPPVPFQSALLTPPVPGAGPTAPLSVYTPIAGGVWVPLAPPPLPVGVCEPIKKKPGTSAALTKKKQPGPCAPGGGGGGEVPEPATWLLLASGLAAIYWQARRYSTSRI